jgi:hypothetical protein
LADHPKIARTAEGGVRSKSLFGSGLAGNYKEIIPRIFSKRMAAPLILFESADFIFLRDIRRRPVSGECPDRQCFIDRSVQTD